MIAFLGVLLALDTAFPDLLFKFQHGLAVEGGEPSEFYRMGAVYRKNRYGFGNHCGGSGQFSCTLIPVKGTKEGMV